MALADYWQCRRGDDRKKWKRVRYARTSITVQTKPNSKLCPLKFGTAASPQKKLGQTTVLVLYVEHVSWNSSRLRLNRYVTVKLVDLHSERADTTIWTCCYQSYNSATIIAPSSTNYISWTLRPHQQTNRMRPDSCCVSADHCCRVPMYELVPSRSVETNNSSPSGPQTVNILYF